MAKINKGTGTKHGYSKWSRFGRKSEEFREPVTAQTENRVKIRTPFKNSKY